MSAPHPMSPIADRRCAAHNRQGRPCGNRPVPGARVCRLHGGSAPQVIASARVRLLAAADPAAAALVELTRDPDPGIRLRSSTAVLDRAGFGANGGHESNRPDLDRRQAVLVAKLYAVMAGILSDLGFDPADPAVRAVVAGRIRGMSADTRHEALDASARELPG